MNRPQKKTPQDEERQAKSSTPEQEVKKTVEIPESAYAAIERMAAMMEPVMKFHAAVEEARESDVRIFWDVRVIKGKDELIVNNVGSASIPRGLSGSRRAKMPFVVHQEIVEKIANPLLAELQDMTATEVLDNLAKLENKAPVVAIEDEEDPDADLGPDTRIAEAAAAAAEHHE